MFRIKCSGYNVQDIFWLNSSEYSVDSDIMFKWTMKKLCSGKYKGSRNVLN